MDMIGSEEIRNPVNQINHKHHGFPKILGTPPHAKGIPLGKGCPWHWRIPSPKVHRTPWEDAFGMGQTIKTLNFLTAEKR